jgi:N-methylhydantoinase A
MSGSFSLGIDIGGTFTDIVIHDSDTGRILIWKELTTPKNPTIGVISGIKQLLQSESMDPSRIDRVVHATTLFTNALIERKGAKTGLITTAGFRDVLEIGRERKYELYDLFIHMPVPLVPRHLRREVAERLSEKGEIEIPLDETALMQEVDELIAQDVRSVAIIFLHAYANPVHEHRVVELISKKYPDLSITASYDVAPEIREYERSSTTAVNAYIKPLAQEYLDLLSHELEEIGITGAFFLMLSNGGLTHIDEAKRSSVQLLESGPAAGALAGSFFGLKSGHTNVLAFDMGGTTAKLSLIDDGEPMVTYAFEAAREKRFMEGSGLPIRISTIELIEIGAGGGSIAHVDDLGLLKVGPQSSGADPGPACYGRGGAQPTVTDADLILGYLNPDFFLGGGMHIEAEAANGSLESLSGQAGLSVQETVWGIHNIVNENMSAAALVHISERGKDIKDYALLATGGAGPVHAYNLAKKLTIKKLICPPAAGVGSAVGLLMAPARIDRVVSMVCRIEELDWPAFESLYKQLEKDAVKVLSETGAVIRQLEIRRLADMRYAGQGSEIVVHLPPGPYSNDSKAAIVTAFEDTYRRLFSRIPPDVAIQLVNLRVSVSAPMTDSKVEFAMTGQAAGNAFKQKRSVFFEEKGGYVQTPVYDRYRISVGEMIDGPAVFEEKESTLVIGPGSVCQAQPDGSLIVTIS